MATDKLKKLARLVALEDSPAVTTEMELERVDFLLDEHSTKIEEVQTGCEQIVQAVNQLDQIKADKEDVAQQIENIARIPGRPGNQGPVGPKGDRGERGEKGDTTIVDRIIEKTEIVKEQPIIKTEVIKEVTLKEDIKGEELVARINELPLDNDKKIGAEHIKGLPQAMSKHYPVGVSEVRVKALIDEKVKENDATNDTLQGVTDRGATTDNVITVPGVQFDVNNTPLASTPGLMQWNETDETVDLNMPDDVTLQIGQELQLKARNNTTSTILNGYPVYSSGMLGNRPTIALAKGDADSTGKVLGLATQDIPKNNDGKITTFGYVRNINTTGTPFGQTWVDGDTLWVSKTTAGYLTNVEPAVPHHSDVVGQVVNAHATQGSILVNIRHHNTLEELSDINGTPLTTTGQFPSWNQTAGYFDFDDDILAYYDGTAGHIKTSKNNPSDLNIDCGTDKTMVLSETVWVDIDYPIIIRTTGANIPTLTTFNGNLTMPQWEVNDFNVCESQEFIHEWKEGSTCYWHVHVNTNGSDTTDRYLKFELEYGYSVAGAWTFPAVVTTADILIPANTADKTQIIMPLANFTPTGAKIGDHCVARLKRVSATGTAPTNNPWIPMLQMHIQKDTIGSRMMITK
jgi:hypothetical protein